MDNNTYPAKIDCKCGNKYHGAATEHPGKVFSLTVEPCPVCHRSDWAVVKEVVPNEPATNVHAGL